MLDYRQKYVMHATVGGVEGIVSSDVAGNGPEQGQPVRDQPVRISLCAISPCLKCAG